MKNKLDVKEIAEAIKSIIALDGGTTRLDNLNRELANCNLHVTYNSASNLDYGNPENASPIEALIGSMK